jgi:hypothetical protein
VSGGADNGRHAAMELMMSLVVLLILALSLSGHSL